MALTILYVEDNRTITDAVREMFSHEGWRLEVCEDGLAGLSLIESDTHYDLLMLDNELPHMSGVELIRKARKLPHRKATPIVMLSAIDHAIDAYSVGVDVFLRKPEDMGLLVPTITKLLNDNS